MSTWAEIIPDDDELVDLLDGMLMAPTPEKLHIAARRVTTYLDGELDTCTEVIHAGDLLEPRETCSNPVAPGQEFCHEHA